MLPLLLSTLQSYSILDFSPGVFYEEERRMIAILLLLCFSLAAKLACCDGDYGESYPDDGFDNDEEFSDLSFHSEGKLSSVRLLLPTTLFRYEYDITTAKSYIKERLDGGPFRMIAIRLLLC
ncbi:hypothetical protein AVEN_113735-1 [Araneus ventricosus]|uniref:Uncharacterized protein n=1 Tax=Araneus ventricosus TaxID=182803 RepID=A0A4Y2QUZ0_ARAVE|nr:hypothetical protein AVEN_113735-1 [Araneus ventricosus]